MDSASSDARLDPLAMLVLVAADHIDLDELHRQARGGVAPVGQAKIARNNIQTQRELFVLLLNERLIDDFR